MSDDNHQQPAGKQTVPEVSVIIPTYNSARYLTAAVESVLDQSFRDFEILVIDDGSTDHTEQAMASYGSPVRYIRQQNSGVAAARNHGIRESRGRYIAFLDADDTWLPHKLERQLGELVTRPDYRACFSAFFVVDGALNLLGISHGSRSDIGVEELLTRGNVVGSICSVLCARSLLEITGSFDSALSQCADWDLWVRVAIHTRFHYVDEPLVTYRQHATNMSRNVPLLESDSFHVLAKGFNMEGLPASLRDRRQAAFARNYMVLAGCYFKAGCYRQFLRCATRALCLDYRQAGYLLGFPVRRLTGLLSRGKAVVA